MSNPIYHPFAEAIKVVKKKDPNDEVSLESLLLLIHAQRMQHLQGSTENEFGTLSDRQKAVAELHHIIQAINSVTNADGSLDITENLEIQELINKAKEMEVETKDGQLKFNALERDRLIENIRMTVEDMNIQNDMQLQTVSRLTNERYESYQFLRSIVKTLHDMKMSSTKAIRGG